MTAGDFGYELNIPTTQDMTGMTPSLALTRPDGTQTSLSLTLGTTILTANGTEYPAGQWAYRTVQAADFAQVGSYTAKLVVTQGGSSRLSSPDFTLSVTS